MALARIKVIEFAGLAPGPFAGLILADNGASVIRVNRPSAPSTDVLSRGKRSIIVDSKVPSGRDLLKKLITSADVVIDPFRPGVMEKLGLGPQVFLGDEQRKGLNEKLIYARIVGFPRTGHQKNMAGHDLNYLASSGILALLPPGPSGSPSFPLNILADFAGGGLTCALGITLALVERMKTGRGQVLDVDMVSGVRYLSTFPFLHTMFPSLGSLGRGKPGTNILDGGAPFYNVYECKGGGWMSVGCLEPQFFKVFIETFNGALPKDFEFENGWKPTTATQTDLEEYPRLKSYLVKGFLTNTRDYWTKVFHDTDACVVPMLSPKEAAAVHGSPVQEFHPCVAAHDQSHKAKPNLNSPKDIILAPGLHTEEVLREAGFSQEEIKQFVHDGVFGKDMQDSARGNAKL